MEEVYAPGKWNSHLSDDVAAFALAHNAANRQAPPAAEEGVPKMSHVARSQREGTYGPGAPRGGGGANGRGGDEPRHHSLTRATWRVHVGRPIEGEPSRTPCFHGS